MTRKSAGSGRWSRRRFLEVTTAATGGMLVGFSIGGSERALASASEDGPFRPNAFLRIDPDGTVTISVPRPEMGQGVRTSLPMIIAEELDCDWSSVRIEQADLNPVYGEQYVGGSNSIPHSFRPLREAGAAARSMLVSAAALEWNVDPSSCRTERGEVCHQPSGRRLRYGALVDRARTLSLPENAPLKEPERFEIIGKPTKSLDAPAIVDGSIRFGLDTRVPGMLFAVIERSPVVGARPARVERERALAIRGVRNVVLVDGDALPDFGEDSPRPPNGVAVVADSTWAAMKGREALSIDWEGGYRDESTEGLRDRAVTKSGRPPERIKRNDGDVETALARSAKTIDAVYELPLLAHASMEPMNAIADVGPDRCEIWAPCQDPGGVRKVACLVTGLPPEKVLVHPLRMGGGFGRRFYVDYVAEAIVISREVRKPVQVVWSREDDIQHGFYRPCAYHVMRAGIDEHGKPIAWVQYLVNASRGEFLEWGLPQGMKSFPAGADLGKYDFPAGLVENLRLQASAVATKIPRGQWRAIEESTNVFVYQSFLDEVAHLAGRDPLEIRLEMLGEPREMPYDDDPRYTYSTERLSRVFRLAAEKAGWGGTLPPGRGRGIAGAYANEAYVAEVVEVTVDSSGKLSIDRVVAAVDCGIAVNPLGVQAQVEGSIVFGLSAALGQRITVRGGAVVESNFDDFPLLRLDACPEIEVHLVPSTGDPLGMGEPALPPVAPALANAIFAATGKRLRRLPIVPEDLRTQA
jgi:isoquinoline 1-oxidoreductase subunit beta